MSTGLVIVPCTLKEAAAFIERHHRHCPAPRGCRFVLAVARAAKVVGVAVVGRPLARRLQDGYTAEVTRVCVLEGERNAASKLYAACWRAARAIGYRRLVTYNRPQSGESGASLRAAGWKVVAQTDAGSWSRKDRPRVDLDPAQRKLRWEVSA
jgi:L-amino acid N-acyltransferase YncA